MPTAEREALFAGYPKLNSPVRIGDQDVLALYEHLGYAIGPLLTFYKCLIQKHQDKQ